MRSVVLTALVLVASCLPVASQACNSETGAREQSVFLSWNGKSVTHWVVDPGAIKRITLPNGFALGVRIEDPEPERLAERNGNIPHGPEMVKITLYDLGGGNPRELTYTYGGANSLQGYGSQGGADRVQELGSPGVLLTLLKPVCAGQAPATTTL